MHYARRGFPPSRIGAVRHASRSHRTPRLQGCPLVFARDRAIVRRRIPSPVVRFRTTEKRILDISDNPPDDVQGTVSQINNSVKYPVDKLNLLQKKLAVYSQKINLLFQFISREKTPSYSTIHLTFLIFYGILSVFPGVSKTPKIGGAKPPGKRLPDDSCERPRPLHQPWRMPWAEEGSRGNFPRLTKKRDDRKSSQRRITQWEYGPIKDDGPPLPNSDRRFAEILRSASIIFQEEFFAERNARSNKIRNVFVKRGLSITTECNFPSNVTMINLSP